MCSTFCPSEQVVVNSFDTCVEPLRNFFYSTGGSCELLYENQHFLPANESENTPES